MPQSLTLALAPVSLTSCIERARHLPLLASDFGDLAGTSSTGDAQGGNGDGKGPGGNAYSGFAGPTTGGGVFNEGGNIDNTGATSMSFS